MNHKLPNLLPIYLLPIYLLPIYWGLFPGYLVIRKPARPIGTTIAAQPKGKLAKAAA
jgi:hypothetical protein